MSTDDARYPSVEDMNSMQEAAVLQNLYWELARDACTALADYTAKGHLYPLANGYDLVWVKSMLDNAFRVHGFDLFDQDKEPVKRVPLTESQRDEIYTRDGRICRWCGTKEYLTIDHIHPVSLGGSNDPSNLQVLCASCNSWKSNRSEA